MGLWGFLSVCVIGGIIFAMYNAYLEHQREIKKLELEAQNHQTKEVNKEN